jgi:VanZ family protein
VLVLCWLYGLSDEVHQIWVPGRSADILDWLVDGLGIFTVGWLWGYWRRSHLRGR